MNCYEFRQQLESIILERTAPTTKLAEHGCNCEVAECRDLWRDYVLLEAQLPLWLEQESGISSLDPLSVVRAAKEFSAAQDDPRPVVRTETQLPVRRWLAVAVAGVAVVGVIAALSTTPDRSEQMQASHEHRVEPSIAVSPEVENIPAVEDDSSQEALTELSQTYVGWIHGSAHQISETVGFVLSTPPSMDPLPVLPWYDSLQEQLQPLEESFQKTMDGLMQEVNGETSQAG